VKGERVRLDGDEAIPGLVVAVQGRTQTAYRAYLDHAMECAACSRGGRCEAGEAMWTEYADSRR
jgi:hypothetical protein